MFHKLSFQFQALCSQYFVLRNALYWIEIHAVFIEIWQIKEIKIPIGSPYK